LKIVGRKWIQGMDIYDADCVNGQQEIFCSCILDVPKDKGLLDLGKLV
jgi:hypothetical protein